MSNFTYDENIFSDLYKDTHGFRPRGHEFYTATPERKQEIWDATCQELEYVLEHERKDKLNAQRALEERIQETIECGAGDRATAIRWICDAEGIDAYDAVYGGSYFCYHFGIDYSLQSMFDDIAAEILERDGDPRDEWEAA